MILGLLWIVHRQLLTLLGLIVAEVNGIVGLSVKGIGRRSFCISGKHRDLQYAQLIVLGSLTLSLLCLHFALRLISSACRRHGFLGMSVLLQFRVMSGLNKEDPRAHVVALLYLSVVVSGCFNNIAMSLHRYLCSKVAQVPEPVLVMYICHLLVTLLGGNIQKMASDLRWNTCLA